jgi:hypothetical protein
VQWCQELWLTPSCHLTCHHFLSGSRVECCGVFLASDLSATTWEKQATAANKQAREMAPEANRKSSLVVGLSSCPESKQAHPKSPAPVTMVTPRTTIMSRDGSPARRSSDLSRKSCAPWDFCLLSMSNIEQVDMITIIMTSASTGGTCLSKATLVTARAVGMPKSTSITLSHVGSREFTVAASASQPSSCQVFRMVRHLQLHRRLPRQLR